MKIAFLASGTGSNVRAVVDACNSGSLKAFPAVVISNNASAPVLAFARDRNIPAIHLERAQFDTAAELDRAMLTTLQHHKVDLVILAGYLKLLGPETVNIFSRRILNIHPALLPKYGGKGMYGLNVHRAVIEAGETETGVTIHLVNERYDEGDVVAQTSVPVLPDDTPEQLGKRVLKREHSFLVETLSRIASGDLIPVRD